MKKILSLCINLMLLMISDAVPLKLIAGDRNVIKKDGATHVISKYYVVPNDYDPNNVTDTTAATQKVSRHMHSRYSKSMDSGTIVKENSENNATTENYQSDDDDADVTVEKINDQVNFRTDLNVGQGEVTNPPDNSTESTVSMSTEQTLDKQTNKQTMDSDDLSKLQVVPIIIPINISHIVTDDKIDTNVNSGEAVQNGGGFIVVNDTDYQNIEDAIDDLILSKFGIAVSDIYSQNLGSFWKLIKLNIDKELGDEELLATIEQLSQLLNIFTNLYEAAQMQHPVEKMIDGIVEILQKPFVEKSNRSESQTETNISGDYDEECLRKCGQKSFKPQLNSNRTTYLSETEASDSLELENLERRQNSDSDDNDLIKMSDDPDSNQETVSSEPTNVLRNQLPVPYNLNVGIPDGYNVLSSMTTPTLIDVARYNDIQEDPNSIQNIPDSTETVESLDLPLTIKSRTSHDLPWSIKDKTIEYFPWPIQTTPNDGLSWHIEDKTSGYHPLTIKYRTSNEIPWNIDSETVPTWTSDPGVTTHGGNILLNPNQSIKSTVHSVKNGIEKPYHIYTYVINPTVTLHKVPNADNVVQVVSRQPHENLKTTLYGLPTLHGENKVVYKNQPPQSHNESQYSLTKPTNNISRQPSYSQLTPHVTKTYDQRYEVNPSTLHSQTPQEDYEPQNFVGKGSEPNHKPARLQSNTHPSESQPTSGEEREAPTVPENDSPPGDLLIPSNPFESLLSFGNTELVSTASVNSSSGDPRNVIDDIDNRHTKPNSYYPYGNINPNKPSLYPASVNKASAHSSVQTSQYPRLISASASSSTYTNGLDEPVYGGQVYQQPSAISTASANSKYTIVQNDNDVPTQVYGGDTNNYPKYIVEPVYSGQVYQQPGAISTATANSKHTIVQNDNDVPTQVYGGDTNNYPKYIVEPVYNGQVYQQPGAISTASGNSKYTIVQNDNDVPTQVHGGDTKIYPGYIDEPVYGGQVYQQPGAISTATVNSKYTIVQNDNDVPTQVYGGDTKNYPKYIVEPVYNGQVYQQPGAISTASGNFKYTIVQNDNDVPTQVHGGDTKNYPGYIDEPVYGGQVYQQPGAISTATANSKYTIVQNDNDVPIQVHGGNANIYPGYIDEPVYGGQVYKQPGGIPPPTANFKYTIVQNDKDVPIQVHGADINPGYISKAIAHSEYTNVPIDYGHDTNTQPGLISEIHQQPVYPNAVDDFDDSIPVNGEQIQKHPSYISKASAHSVYTIPVNFNVPTHDNKVALDIEPAKIQNVPNYPDEVNHYIKTNPVNGGPKQIRDKFLVPYQPYGPIVHVIHQPSLIKTIVSNQNLKLAPTYRLFALQNLQNLKNTIIKTIQIPGRGFYDDRALINLKNIINVILLLAENLEETDGTNAWYEKIFYNSEHSQHPLRHYVYNLIRQRWLHELMLVLYKNNFSINILQNLGIFSLLKSWQFPKYVQNFIEAEELLHVPNPQNYNDISKNINDLQHKFSVHTYDNLLEAPVDLAKYVTKNVIDSYKTPNKGIVLSIGGVEAEPDANAIINILQNYLNYKNYIETQDNENVFENKVEMLKQIILFLKKKGYGPNTIADLIQKLNTAVYSTEKRGCKTQPTNFTKYMYDVILPVLRRSGR